MAAAAGSPSHGVAAQAAAAIGCQVLAAVLQVVAITAQLVAAHGVDLMVPANHATARALSLGETGLPCTVLSERERQYAPAL